MPRTTQVTITFTVEEKEECAYPGPADPAEVLAVASDLLRDLTRAEWEWSWMVTDARLATPTGAPH